MPTSWRTLSLTLAAAVAVGMTPVVSAAAPALPSAPFVAPAEPGTAGAAPAEPGTAGAAPQRAPLPEPAVEAPTPDVLDVDLASGSTADSAQDRTVTGFGAAPEIAADTALGRKVAAFDGTNALRYDYADGFDTTSKALTLECTVRFDGGLSDGESEGTGNFCGAKEAGGYSLTAYGSTLKMVVNVDGTYYGTGVEVQEGVWYHATGVWDGKTVALYLNGEKVAETPTKGSSITPPKESARQFFLGADTNSSGNPQFHGTTSLATAGIYSRALNADEITARYAQTFADRAEGDVTFELGSPVPDAQLTAPTALAGTVGNEELLAAPLSFTLDGEPVDLGDEIGQGLREGEHTIAYTGTDAFGGEVSGSSTFTSASIPTAGGATQEYADGSAQLSARAEHPSGGDLHTSFLEGEVTTATNVEQGVIDPAVIAADGTVAGDVELQDAAAVEDALDPADDQLLDAPVSEQVPALRTDIPFTTEGQDVLWQGQVDPSREVRLLLLNTETGSYEVADTARGDGEGQVELSASAAAHHDSGGTIKALVLGTDPFADDLDEPIRDGFEDPDSFDFSLMHITDTQYLSEGAAGRPSTTEREVWAEAYEGSYRWVAEHGEEHKLAYVAHTGDVIENWNTNAEHRGVAIREFEFASETQEILEDTGIPHSVIPGNHDNRGGNDVGPDSLYNDYFGPERYEALAQTDSWKEAGAEYHPWKPGDNQNSYNLFTAAGRDFIAINLGYSVTEEETAWASEILDQYPTRNAIILTHAYNKPSDAADGRGGSFSKDGQIIREQLLAEHPNIALVLSGHEHGVSISVRKDVGTPGNNVVELLADYQFYEVSAEQMGLDGMRGYDADTGLQFGASFFRLLQFDLDRGEMAVDTYSAQLDEFGATEYDTKGRYDGHEDDFRLPVQFEGRTTTFRTDTVMGLTPSDRLIGEATHASGEPATADWSDLEEGAPYGWYAITQDASRAIDPKELRAAALGAGAGTVSDGAASDATDGIVQSSVFTATETGGATP
ncbi:Purple acid phosphatase/fibronectin domain protein [Corynebacterium xerosis]|nr:Purple acid phosphatase/fibronectin domain protein [Corynebacterium xerosis]